jgi:hypothetical protein
MKYVIIGLDAPGSLPKRKAVREAHLARLQLLQDAGRLSTAGPMPAVDIHEASPAGFAGSTIIADFDSLATARAWANDDPYVAEGIYREVMIFPYIQVFP